MRPAASAVRRPSATSSHARLGTEIGEHREVVLPAPEALFVQAQVLELLNELTTRLGTALLLISHDLGVMARMAQRVVVMYAGTVLEAGPTAELLTRPRHPYTVGLLDSAPRLTGSRRLRPIEGSPPDMEVEPAGCPFAPRCAWRLPQCWTVTPRLEAAVPGHVLACHNPVEEAEIAAARPLRPGFEAAPPPPGATGDSVAEPA